ncbi:MAG TPA: gluconate 5-dehydrogenase, partial [Alcanivorax sp.]|nr:gluconate 5-dehydrogenase [Alcanivorax sp.]
MSEPQTRSVQQLMDLSGRTALVTGGSRGLGLQMAQALGEAGARLVISSRKANELEEAAEQLRAAGIDVTPLAVDLADEDAVMGLADRALEVLGRVD